MTSRDEHYEKAERLLAEARGAYNNPRLGTERYDLARFLLQQAQVHATLAGAPNNKGKVLTQVITSPAPANAITPWRGFVCDNCDHFVYLTLTTARTVSELRRDHEKECWA